VKEKGKDKEKKKKKEAKKGTWKKRNQDAERKH
jgi:hypothetical protein